MKINKVMRCKTPQRIETFITRADRKEPEEVKIFMYVGSPVVASAKMKGEVRQIE